MTEAANKTTNYDRRSIKESLKMVGWIFVWMLTLVISDKAALYGWWSSEWITIASIAVNAAFGLWVMRTYMQMLGGMDDLQRKIQLESLSMAMGLSLVGTITYSLLVTWGYITDEEVTDIFFIMCTTYSASIFYSLIKYR